jgi:hypothetical protein
MYYQCTIIIVNLYIFFMAPRRGRKATVTLSLDPDLWVKCQRLRAAYGVSWSQVAQQAFAGIVEMLERAEAVHAVDGSDGVSDDLKRQLDSLYFESLSSLASSEVFPSPKVPSK